VRAGAFRVRMNPNGVLAMRDGDVGTISSAPTPVASMSITLSLAS